MLATTNLTDVDMPLINIFEEIIHPLNYQPTHSTLSNFFPSTNHFIPINTSIDRSSQHSYISTSTPNEVSSSVSLGHYSNPTIPQSSLLNTIQIHHLLFLTLLKTILIHLLDIPQELSNRPPQTLLVFVCPTLPASSRSLSFSVTSTPPFTEPVSYNQASLKPNLQDAMIKSLIHGV